MGDFKKFIYYSPSTAFFAFWFIISVVPVFLLAPVKTDSLPGKRYDAENDIAKVKDDQNPVCGTITLSTGQSVTLREGISISEEDFEKVHNGNFTDALFSPVENRRCAIQLCGFSSYGRKYNDNFIGSTGDYADCNPIKKSVTSAYLPQVYNGNFRTSAISCGCVKQEHDCMHTCEERAVKLEKSWKENYCAALFQENGCNSCYSNPVYLVNGQNYSTNNSHHIRSIIVRDQCIVRQNIPAFKRMWQFVNILQPFIYTSNRTSKNVMSAFQREPEHFQCVCDETAATSTTEYTPTPQPHKTPKFNKNSLLFLGLGAGGGIILFGVVLILVKWMKRQRRKSNIFINTNPQFENKDEKENSGPSKFGSIESTSTQLTDFSTISTPESLVVDDDEEDDTLVLDEEQIQRMPFHPTFETKQDHVQVKSPLAEGRFGQVFEGTLKVAVKKVKAFSGSEERESLRQEVKILTHLGSHENVVRILGYVYEQDELSLIIELCEKGSLKAYLSTIRSEREISRGDYDEHGYFQQKVSHSGECTNGNDQNTLEPEMLMQMYQWIYQIASGMEYIQSKNIIHVDLATRNVLLTHKLVAKIGDFGLAKKMYIKNYVSSKKDSLPLRWVAPESFTGERKCSKRSDVWSFGVTVWEIFSLGKDPYGDKDELQVMSSIFKKEKLEIPDYAPPELYSKLLECWNDVPEERPSFESLRLHFYSYLSFDTMNLDVKDAAAVVDADGQRE